MFRSFYEIRHQDDIGIHVTDPLGVCDNLTIQHDGKAAPHIVAGDLSEAAPAEAPSPSRETVQSLMWDHVGIVRDGDSLSRAKATLSALHAALPAPTDRPSHELADLVVCGRLVTEAGLIREESRGAHYRSDFPQTLEEWRRHIVFRKGSPPSTRSS